MSEAKAWRSIAKSCCKGMEDSKKHAAPARRAARRYRIERDNARDERDEHITARRAAEASARSMLKLAEDATRRERVARDERDLALSLQQATLAERDDARSIARDARAERDERAARCVALQTALGNALTDRDAARREVGRVHRR